MSVVLAEGMALSITVCGGPKAELNDGTFKPMDAFRLQEDCPGEEIRVDQGRRSG